MEVSRNGFLCILGLLLIRFPAASQEGGASVPVFLDSFGVRGEAGGQFNRPNGIACDDEGTLFVVDTFNARIQKFDSSARYLRSFGTGQRTGIAFDPISRHLFSTLSPAGHTVTEFDTEGITIRSLWGGQRWPHTTALDRFGRAFVTDTGFNHIRRFVNGSLNLTFAEGGSGPENLYNAAGIAIGPDDRVYVSDWTNDRIQVFTTDGVHLGSWGREGSGPGEFHHPCGVEYAEGYVYVTDWGNNRIQRFTADGGFVDSWGSEGSGPGQFQGPADLCIDLSRGLLYVTDTFNHRVHRYAWTRPSELPPGTIRKDSPPPVPAITGDPPSLTDVIDYNVRSFEAIDRSFHSSGGHWERGYFDYIPPFHVWSNVPLIRVQGDRITALHNLLDSGFLPPATRDTMTLRIRSACEYLLTEQLGNGSFLLYNNDRAYAAPHIFEVGLACEGLARGFQVTGDVRFRDAAVRAATWIRGQSISGNLNYNSFGIFALARTHAITGDAGLLDDAVRRQRFINGYQNGDGSYGDSHNRKTIYHLILLRGALELCGALPSGDSRRAELFASANRGLNFLLSLQDPVLGGFFTAAPGAEPDAVPLHAMGVDQLANGILLLDRIDLAAAHYRAVRYALFVNPIPLSQGVQWILCQRTLSVLRKLHLASFRIQPAFQPMAALTSRNFTASFYDPAGLPFPPGATLGFSASAGTLDSNGSYLAPLTAGLHTLTATSGPFTAAAQVRVPTKALRGDANGDGILNGSDLVFLLNRVYLRTSPPAHLEGGDVNADGIIDTFDVPLLQNVVFLGEPILFPAFGAGIPLDETGRPLGSILVTPGKVSLPPGQTVTFSAQLFGSDGNPFPAVAQWKSTGGSVSMTGLYTAPKIAGTYTVTAFNGSVQGRATVVVGSVAVAQTDP